MTKHVACLCALAFLVTGCEKAVRITSPPVPPPGPTGPQSASLTAPVTSFTVQFHSLYNSGSFRAELDGLDVTSRFIPAAKAGGTSSLVLPDTPEGFSGGSCVGPGPIGQPSNPPVHTDSRPPDAHPSSGAGPPIVPSGGGGSGEPSSPNIKVCSHLLKVTAQCLGRICDTTDELYFYPPHLFGDPLGLTVARGATALEQLKTFNASTVPIAVRVSPSSNQVQLDGQAPGASIFATIPAKGSYPLRVTGLVPANVLLTLEARGVQRGVIPVVVTP